MSSSGQVHRFRDTVAAWLGTGETVYMQPDEALALAKALTKAARSVQREPFGQSSGNTQSLIFSDPLAPLERGATGQAVRSRRKRT